MGIIKKIIHSVVAAILVVNIGVFGYMAWPTGNTAVALKHSGISVVIKAAENKITQGDIYALDTDRQFVEAILRLDAQIYSREQNKLIPINLEEWHPYVITGELARVLLHKTKAYAFTNSENHVIIFLDVPGADPELIIAHEFTHVLQVNAGMIPGMSILLAEYEAELNSRTVVMALSDFPPVKAWPVRDISVFEKLAVVKYLAAHE